MQCWTFTCVVALCYSVLFTVKEYCKATYFYEATNQDELDIKEGDVIHLLSKVSPTDVLISERL